MVDLKQIIERLDGLLTEAGLDESFSEYELITRLKAEALLPDSVEGSNLGLFQKHFLVMHCLYLLQGQYREKELGHLLITATKIKIEPLFHSGQTWISAEAESPELSHYYLDLGNLQEATEDSVSELLTHFWTEFERYSDISDHDFQRALARFDLALPVDQKKLSKAYRKKLQSCHPDKGGDSNEFIEVQRDFSLIKAKLVHT